MYKLTQRRFEKAQDILEKYLVHLVDTREINTSAIEQELCQCWNISYRELKDIMIGLSKNNRFKYLAAYYMEHSGTVGVVCGFKEPLAKMYGIPYYHSEEHEHKAKEFWSRLSKNILNEEAF